MFCLNTLETDVLHYESMHTRWLPNCMALCASPVNMVDHVVSCCTLTAANDLPINT